MLTAKLTKSLLFLVFLVFVIFLMRSGFLRPSQAY